MSDTTVVVVDASGDDEGSEATEVAEVIEEAQEQTEAMMLGALTARVQMLEEKCQYHDDLISLHSHEEFVDRSDLVDSEERICSRMETLVPDEPVVEEPIVEPTPESEVEEAKDEPPKSRRNRKSIAERYYG